MYQINEDSYFYAKAKEIQRIAEAGNIVDVEQDIVTPLTQTEMNNYIISESSRIDAVLNTFDVLYESMTLDPLMKTVTMKTKYGDTISVYLEQAVQKEILTGVNALFR